MSTRWLFDKTILHFHASGVSELYERLPSWQRWFFRRAYFGVDAAIRLSSLTPEDGLHLKAKREYVIPYGIDDPFPNFGIAQSKSGAVPSNVLRILFVGALCELKGLLVLIEACGTLAARNLSFRLEVMGQWETDELATRVADRIHDLNLTDRIHFLGVLIGDEKFAAFRRADVFCFPTFHNCEAFPVVLLEAMGCGLPVVSTRWRGIPSIVDDGKTGFLVKPHDIGAVADRLATLANDSELRLQMGRSGRAKFEREYIFPRHAARLRRVFLDTAGRAPSEPDLFREAVVTALGE